MDILDIQTTFFRRISVHLQNRGVEASFFRPIPVQTTAGLKIIPAHTRSLSVGMTVTAEDLFPAHTRSLPTETGFGGCGFFPAHGSSLPTVVVGCGRVLFPEHGRSLPEQTDVAPAILFRPIPVHFALAFRYLCTGMFSSKTSTTMAGTVKDMSLIKQVIQLKQLGESNRGIAR